MQLSLNIPVHFDRPQWAQPVWLGPSLGGFITLFHLDFFLAG
jgi:hypothetical protein